MGTNICRIFFKFSAQSWGRGEERASRCVLTEGPWPDEEEEPILNPLIPVSV